MCGSCKSQQNKQNISDVIYNIQKTKFYDDELIKGLNIYRKESKWFEKLNYSHGGDTVFILELPGVQGDYYLTFWNGKDTISYSNTTGQFLLVRESLFTRHMMNLISQWDIQSIQMEENMNSNVLPKETVYATKIIFSNKKPQIDCLCFSYFLNEERDFLSLSSLNIDFIEYLE